MNKNSSVYNKYGLYLLFFTVIFSTVFIFYLMFGKNTIDLGEVEKPTLTANQEETKLWVSTEKFISQGSKVYQAQCAVCHGKTGLGDGTPGLLPPPRNLVEGQWQKGGSLQNLFTTLIEGISGTSMVSFKHLSKEDRWSLVHYIHSITKNKVIDDPKELEAFAKKAL